MSRFISLVLALFASAANADAHLPSIGMTQASPEASVTAGCEVDGRSVDLRVDAAKFMVPDDARQGSGDRIPTQGFYLVVRSAISDPSVVGPIDGIAPRLIAYDVDGDGRPELLVRFNVGASAHALHIYTIRNCALSLMPGAAFGSDDEDPALILATGSTASVITYGRDWASPSHHRVAARYELQGGSWMPVSTGDAEAPVAAPCRTQNSTIEINACAKANFDEADKRLNVTYADILRVVRDTVGHGRDPQTPKALLVKAQRKWIEFRDAECRAESSLMEGGSARPSAELYCKIDLTEQRIRALESARWTGY